MLGIIFTRHVNSEKSNKYWNECYHCIRTFYPTNLIKISDLGCFITAINVKYDGDGHPVFFKGEKPVIVDLSISFRERAILTSDDYWDYHSDALNPLGNDKVPGNFIGGIIGGTPV
jgi:hypothetical protein